MRLAGQAVGLALMLATLPGALATVLAARGVWKALEWAGRWAPVR